MVATVKTQYTEVGFKDEDLRNKQFFTLLGMLIFVPKSNHLYILFASHRVAFAELFSSYSFNLEVRLKKIAVCILPPQ